MSQELIDAIKKPQKKLGEVDQAKQKPISKSEIPVLHNAEGFDKNKAMLQNLFGEKQQAEAPPQEIKKDEPKGDQQNFSNAKNLLQQQFGQGGNTNILNVQTSTGIPNLLPPPPPINITNLPPPPPFNLPTPPSLISSKTPSTTASSQKQSQDDALIIQRKKLFDKKNPQRYPLTEQFFGINIAGFIKQQFVKSANIASTIGLEIHKKQHQIHFPTIENKIRAIQPIQTLYADTQSLDLVCCFMNKNLNAVKMHNEQRQQFLSSFTNYSWQTDPLKIKCIRQVAQALPNSTFVEPNFVAIQNAIVRCNDIIQTLSKNEQYLRCEQLKKLIVNTKKILSQYCSHPQNNTNLLQQIDKNVHLMKNVTI